AKDKDKFTPKDGRKDAPSRGKDRKDDSGKAFKDKNAAPRLEEEPSGEARALIFLDDRTYVAGMNPVVRAWIDRTSPLVSGGLSGAVGRLGEGHALVVGLNPAAAPAKATRDLPPNFEPLLKAKVATLVADIGKESAIQFKAEFADEEAAKAGETALIGGVEM